MKKKIFLISGKAQHGKDTFADIYSEFSLNSVNMKLPLAKRLKDVAMMSGWDGVKSQEGRTYLQELGDLIKDTWGQEFFAKCLVEELKKEPYIHAQNIFVPDVRFQSEFYYLQEQLKDEYDVYTVRVERPGWTGGLTDEQLSHRSETNLDAAAENKEFSIYIVNDGDMAEYRKKVIKIMEPFSTFLHGLYDIFQKTTKKN